MADESALIQELDPVNSTAPPNPDNITKGLEAEQNPPVEDNIPEKFRGKSLEDVIQSYSELEKQLGKQGQELGELRRTYDAFIKSEVENHRNEQGHRLDNSNDSFDSYTSSEPAAQGTPGQEGLSPVDRELAELRQERFLAKLEREHPDFRETVQDEAFRDWIVESDVRMALYKRADEQFDYRAADELFNIWADKKAVLDAEKQNAVEAKEQTFEDAQTEQGKPVQPSSERKYRRSDIRALKQNNPDRYRELAPLIRQMYAEGRVIDD